MIDFMMQLQFTVSNGFYDEKEKKYNNANIIY